MVNLSSCSDTSVWIDVEIKFFRFSLICSNSVFRLLVLTLLLYNHGDETPTSSESIKYGVRIIPRHDDLKI